MPHAGQDDWCVAVTAEVRPYLKWIWRLLLVALAVYAVYFWMNADS